FSCPPRNSAYPAKHVSVTCPSTVRALTKFPTPAGGGPSTISWYVRYFSSEARQRITGSSILGRAVTLSFNSAIYGLPPGQLAAIGDWARLRSRGNTSFS